MSGLTDNSDGRRRHLRDGGFPCEQPGGSGVRRKEGNREGGARGSYRRLLGIKTETNHAD
jgi:hypothetical protein